MKQFVDFNKFQFRLKDWEVREKDYVENLNGDSKVITWLATASYVSKAYHNELSVPMNFEVEAIGNSIDEALSNLDDKLTMIETLESFGKS